MKRAYDPFHFGSIHCGKTNGFMSNVTIAWDLPVVGSPNFVWDSKLKNTKAALKDWVKLTKKNPINKRKEALEKLEKIQLEMQDTESTPALLEKGKKYQLKSFELSGEKKNTGD